MGDDAPVESLAQSCMPLGLARLASRPLEVLAPYLPPLRGVNAGSSSKFPTLSNEQLA